MKQILILLTFSLIGHMFAVDPALPEYKKTSGISGNVSSVGSDTLNNLMAFWSEGFAKKYPGMVIQVEGKGSSTAPPALIEGVSQLGPMSRKMKKKELEAFEDKKGYKPTAIGVALDALAVYVNKDNPINEMTLAQVDAIFSKNRKAKYKEDIKVWGQLDIKGKLNKKPISLYGRNSASGTYGYFKKKALFKGDYKETVKEQPGSASVVMGITKDIAGIGYSGIGYKTSGVKTLKIAKKPGKKSYDATAKNVLTRKYPLGRMLYIYIDLKPGKPMPQNVKEFLKFVLSKEGQEIVAKDGYIPLPATVAAKQASLLN